MIEFVAGLGLVLLVLSDIFRTILLPRPTVRALPLSPLLGRLFVPLWFKATERIKSTRLRQTARASLAPLLIILALLFWVALLVFGYGLMIHADSKDIGPAADLAETVYLAGSAFFTLGVGNSIVRERLRSAGYSLCKPEDAAYIRFQQLREDYRPDLIALCRHLRILLQEPPLQGSQPEIARPKRKRTPTTQAEVKA
jgi:hypothetical protein